MFIKAEKKKSKLRLAICGTAGSGKTYSALQIAKGIGGKVAVLDTESGSASLYSNICDFDVCEFKPPFSPERYCQIIKEAELAGYTTLIIDSLSHAWAGQGGLLEIVDNYTAASKSKNGFTEGWKKGTPEQNKLIDAILMANLHIICCIRTKTAWEIQKDERGYTKPVKIGLAPVQRDNVDYEFTLVFDIDNESHLATNSKNRTTLFKGAPFLISEETGKQLVEWLNDGKTLAEQLIDLMIEKCSDNINVANQKISLFTKKESKFTTFNEIKNLNDKQVEFLLKNFREES